jgi:putative oxidoreductase
MTSALLDRVARLFGALERAAWLPLLLLRAFVGYLFLELGWGKVHDLAAMTERFTDWGIPWPAFNAALSSWTELVAGALVLVGLLTRPAAAALAFNMLVAVVSVKLKKVESLADFVEIDEPLYGLVFLLLVFTGPGAASIDHWLSLRFAKSREQAATAP